MFLIREDHPDLLENLNKKSNVPEKAKTPQQLWYCHEKKAFLKIHPDVRSIRTHPNKLANKLLQVSVCALKLPMKVK